LRTMGQPEESMTETLGIHLTGPTTTPLGGMLTEITRLAA